VFFCFVRGYTAPEYAIRGELSEKADIYSFGVLLLEIICCRKNTDHTLPPDMQYLPEYVSFEFLILKEFIAYQIGNSQHSRSWHIVGKVEIRCPYFNLDFDYIS